MEKVFRFRIVEEVRHRLAEDLETIESVSSYRLYQKVPWILGNWQRVYHSYNENGYDYFISVEAAKERALEVVENWKQYQKELNAEKKHKDELKTTVKIVLDFEIPAN